VGFGDMFSVELSNVGSGDMFSGELSDVGSGDMFSVEISNVGFCDTFSGVDGPTDSLSKKLPIILYPKITKKMKLYLSIMK
jgi:hypothetical protein